MAGQRTTEQLMTALAKTAERINERHALVWKRPRADNDNG